MIRGLSLPGWSNLLLALNRLEDNQTYCQKVYREVRIASSHVRNIISHLEEKELIKREKKGRIKHITLTRKGKQIAKDVLKLKQDLNKELSAFEKMKDTRKPVLNETVKTDYGIGKVIKIINYDDMKDKFNNKNEKERFLATVKHFLGSEHRYFEFMVQYNDGEIDLLDWSQYKDNFRK